MLASGGSTGDCGLVSKRRILLKNCSATSLMRTSVPAEVEISTEHAVGVSTSGLLDRSGCFARAIRIYRSERGIMPGRKTHQLVGATAGVAFAALEAKNQPSQHMCIEMIGGGFGGY